jgi:hypothetical protein
MGRSNRMSDEIDDLQAFLAEEGSDLTEAQVLALREFIDQAGSLEEAVLAIEMLEQLNKAA